LFCSPQRLIEKQTSFDRQLGSLTDMLSEMETSGPFNPKVIAQLLTSDVLILTFRVQFISLSLIIYVTLDSCYRGDICFSKSLWPLETWGQ